MELMDHEYEDQISVNTKIVKPIKGGFLFHWVEYIFQDTRNYLVKIDMYW